MSHWLILFLQVPSAQRYSTAVGGQSEDFQQYGTGFLFLFGDLKIGDWIGSISPWHELNFRLRWSLLPGIRPWQAYVRCWGLFFNLCSELYLPTAFQVLKIQPNNEKALFRKAKILQEKHQLDEAIGFHSKLGLVWNSTSLGILRRINRLYPANKQCHTELAKLTNKVCVRSLSFDCQHHF